MPDNFQENDNVWLMNYPVRSFNGRRGKIVEKDGHGFRVRGPEIHVFAMPDELVHDFKRDVLERMTWQK